MLNLDCEDNMKHEATKSETGRCTDRLGNYYFIGTFVWKYSILPIRWFNYWKRSCTLCYGLEFGRHPSHSGSDARQQGACNKDCGARSILLTVLSTSDNCKFWQKAKNTLKMGKKIFVLTDNLLSWALLSLHFGETGWKSWFFGRSSHLRGI